MSRQHVNSKKGTVEHDLHVEFHPVSVVLSLLRQLPSGSIHFSRYEISTPFLSTSQIANICRLIHTTTVSPRRVLVPNCNRHCSLDRLYIDCVLPPGAQPAQLTNAQLCAHRSQDRPYLCSEVLGYKRSDVVRGTYQADCRCVRSLLLFRWLG